MRIGLPFKIALLGSAIILLLGNALVVRQHQEQDWMDYQKQYFQLAAEKAEDPQVKQMLLNRTPRIEQMVVTTFGEQRVDRCTTCHTTMDDPRFVDAPQPFRAHPQLPENHPFQQFGCTACHHGNGRGLTTTDAHGKRKHWEEPLLEGNYIEAGCAKCHPAPYLDETPMLRRGAKLFLTNACYGCHKVEGVSNGKLGVELTRTGEKWPVDYLVESIVEPKANNIQSIMPKMELPPHDVEALAIYLKSLTGENLVDGSVPHYRKIKEWKNETVPEVPVSVAVGESLFYAKACNACHMINGEGGEIGPDLSVYGLQRTKEWMILHHIDPRSLIPGSIMPDFAYSQSELDAMALFLEAQTERTVSFQPEAIEESMGYE